MYRDLTPTGKLCLHMRHRIDMEILFGRSAAVTGIPGPHARRRMAAVAAERLLAEQIAEHEAKRSAG